MSPAFAVETAKFVSSSLEKSVAPQEAAGGAYRDRTDDPLLAKQVLSQLS